MQGNGHGTLGHCAGTSLNFLFYLVRNVGVRESCFAFAFKNRSKVFILNCINLTA